MRRPRGQAAVETALTLPLVLFMILGALQLFMVLQARILAQYAASRAVRAGAMSFGDCRTMNDVAHLVLLPAIDAKFANGKYGPLGAAYAQQAQRRMTANQYLAERDADGNLDGPVVWLDRITPVGPFPRSEEETWDLPPHQVLDVRMVFWAPLKIPFANQVFARIALAQRWGLKELHTADPLMPVKRDAGWVNLSNKPVTDVATEMQTRYDLKQYVFPIEVRYAMRMMSPARFRTQSCH